MFERFTERARRSIFFARYEASIFGSPAIKAEELLLGLLREDKTIALRLANGATEAIRKEIEQHADKRERISTSVDLPLSHDAKRVLAYAAEESERMNHKLIDWPHLVLGVLREEDTLAAKLLRKYGLELEAYRKIVSESPPPPTDPLLRSLAVGSKRPRRPDPEPAFARVALPETSLQPAISALRKLVENTADQVRLYSDAYGDQRLKRKPWTRKEALGHLIDWGIAHQQWVTLTLLEGKLRAAGYLDEAAVAAQHYADFPWVETVDLWASLNRLLLHVLTRIPEEKLGLPCRIGVAEPVALSKLIENYLAHCEDIVGQILARLD